MQLKSALIIAVSLSAIGSRASSQTIRFPLPGLHGPQSINSLDWDAFWNSGPTVSILKSELPTAARFIGFEWSGTIEAGHVVGDGVEREAIEQILQGSFVPSLDGWGEEFARLPTRLPPFGPFDELWQLDRLPGTFIDRNCADCEYPPETITIELRLVPDYITLGNSIPFFNPSSGLESRDANQGLILLKEIRAEIMSAALVFQAVPEPGAGLLAIMAIAQIIVSRVRSRH